MKLKGCRMRRIILLIGLLFWVPTSLLAQDFPTRPINILVGLAPGGVVDGSIRMLASKAEKFLGQPFVITNNGGGGGSVAYGILAKGNPDGYHLVGSPSTPLVRVPHIRPVPYKPEDFAPIMHFGSSVTGLVVKADAPYKTLKEFVEYAKKNPWKIAYATIGTGTPHHVAMEFIAKKEGIQWTMVPYPGGAPGLTALLGGHVSAFSGGTVWIPYVKEGTVRLLCTYNERRMKTFPEVTVLRELGYDYIDETVFMLAAPKGTPPSVLKKLDDAFLKAMDDLDFVSYMERIETELSYRNYVETKKYLEEAYRSVGKLIIELKIPKEDEKKP
jgi:tripartite-type tricarboxylate transporter receptor subunit TctC